MKVVTKQGGIVAGLQKILLVEDNLELRDIYKYFLENHGFKVRDALDGAKALEAAKEFKPDLILLDIMMPEMDGLEALKHLRHDPQYNSTKSKIVILTNLGDSSKVDEEVSKDIDGYVVKAEIVLHDLLDIIASLEKN